MNNANTKTTWSGLMGLHQEQAFELCAGGDVAGNGCKCSGCKAERKRQRAADRRAAQRLAEVGW